MKRIVPKAIIFAALILSAVVTTIHPVYPKEQLLQHAGTLLILAILIIDLKKDNLPVTSFVSVSLFAIIHLVGARYIYSFVPYRDWIINCFHFDINTFFDTPRNHYDRFVHLMFGILAFPYLFHITGERNIPGKLLRLIVVWSFIQAFSLFYEIFEWSLSIFMSPETADSYNGQQGDMWDVQKDMFLVMIGSAVMVVIYMFKQDKNR